MTAANPQSLPAYRFVASLNEMNNIHERRITALRNHVPIAVTFMLVGTAMVAMGFTGYNAGIRGARRRLTALIMSVTIALLIMLVVDLDRPYRGLIQVPVQALVDAAQTAFHGNPRAGGEALRADHARQAASNTSPDPKAPSSTR